MTDIAALASDQYLTAKQVRARLGGVSNTWLFRRMRDEGFPQPASRFGGRQRYWLLSELVEWEISRSAPLKPRLGALTTDSTPDDDAPWRLKHAEEICLSLRRHDHFWIARRNRARSSRGRTSSSRPVVRETRRTPGDESNAPDKAQLVSCHFSRSTLASSVSALLGLLHGSPVCL